MTNGRSFFGDRSVQFSNPAPLPPFALSTEALGWKHEAKDQLMVQEQKTWKNQKRL